MESSSGVSDTEKTAIDHWIEAHGLNKYGDPMHTMYTGGTPLFDETTGTSVDRYVYIVRQHPTRPWTSEADSDSDESSASTFDDEEESESEEEEALETDSNGNLRSTLLEAKLASVAESEPGFSHGLLKAGLSLAVFCVLIVVVAVAKAAQRRSRFTYGSISSREH